MQNYQGIAYFQTLAHYNRWANARLYTACLALSPDDYDADRRGFFGSIGRTLNHILVGDTLWLTRFNGETLPPGTRLDAVPHPDRHALWAARQETDATIINLFDSYTDEKLGQSLNYADTSGAPKSAPFPILFGHFFNHQTHHRGQIHHMLTMAGVNDPPALDFSYFYLEG